LLYFIFQHRIVLELSFVIFSGFVSIELSLYYGRSHKVLLTCLLFLWYFFNWFFLVQIHLSMLDLFEIRLWLFFYLSILIWWPGLHICHAHLGWLRSIFFFNFFFFHLIGWNLSFIVFLVSVIVFIFIGFHDYFLFNVVNLLSFVYFFYYLIKLY
jgi:hypothetical protein